MPRHVPWFIPNTRPFLVENGTTTSPVAGHKKVSTILCHAVSVLGRSAERRLTIVTVAQTDTLPWPMAATQEAAPFDRMFEPKAGVPALALSVHATTAALGDPAQIVHQGWLLKKRRKKMQGASSSHPAESR